MALYGGVSRHNVDQTVSGVKTFDGTLDISGTFQLGGTTVAATAAELDKMDGFAGTTTELNLLAGSVSSNSAAGKLAKLDASKFLQTNANNGAAGTNVTVVHTGTGLDVTAVLTLTNVVLTVGTSAALGVGSLVYTLPAGACMVRDAYMSVDLAGVSTTNDTPEVGIGTVIASGGVSVLSGTGTFEDIVTGQVAADTNGTATVKGAGPTAGAPLEIATGAAHTVHVNWADTWGANADASALINGTVVIHYTRQAA